MFYERKTRFSFNMCSNLLFLSDDIGSYTQNFGLRVGNLLSLFELSARQCPPDCKQPAAGTSLIDTTVVKLTQTFLSHIFFFFAFQ